jgi:hypothetical protein
VGARLLVVIVRSILLPHTVIRFFVSPASRFYAIILTLSLAGMAAFNYLTLPAFFEVIGFTMEPFPAIHLDQALVILLPNLVNILCVTYFSIFAGSFISMLPIILFSKSLRKKPVIPPALDVLLKDPAASREYLGREIHEEDIWPTIVTGRLPPTAKEPGETNSTGLSTIDPNFLSELPRSVVHRLRPSNKTPTPPLSNRDPMTAALVS